jgi:hypothetical protein
MEMNPCESADMNPYEYHADSMDCNSAYTFVDTTSRKIVCRHLRETMTLSRSPNGPSVPQPTSPSCSDRFLAVCRLNGVLPVRIFNLATPLFCHAIRLNIAEESSRPHGDKTGLSRRPDPVFGRFSTVNGYASTRRGSIPLGTLNAEYIGGGVA